MTTPFKILIVLIVAAAGAAAVVLRSKERRAPDPQQQLVAGKIPAAPAIQTDAPPVPVAFPKLIDLGADKCIPCKMMAPILEELKREYAGKMNVEFIDVWKDPAAGEKYGIQMIPTQIFYDATGKERFRHTGFYGKEDILGKWKELGVDLLGQGAPVLVREATVAK